VHEAARQLAQLEETSRANGVEIAAVHEDLRELKDEFRGLFKQLRGDLAYMQSLQLKDAEGTKKNWQGWPPLLETLYFPGSTRLSDS
jgi:hypothetical protein